jgi:hypothetical protein
LCSSGPQPCCETGDLKLNQDASDDPYDCKDACAANAACAAWSHWEKQDRFGPYWMCALRSKKGTAYIRHSNHTTGVCPS